MSVQAQTPTRLCICGALITNGAWLCREDTEQVMHEVRTASDTLRELTTTLARLDRVAPASVGGKGSETPMPYNVGASEAATALRGAVRVLARGRVGHAEVSAFRAAHRRALEAIDLADPRVFVGLCTCDAQTPLYARSSDTEVTCRACREVWEAKPLEAWDQVRRLSGSVPKLRVWLLALGVTRSRAQLYRDIAPLDPVDDGVYSLSDVLDQVVRTKTRRSRSA